MSKKDKLAALRKARSGGSIREVYEDPEYESIFQEIDDEEYKKRKRDALLQDEFVVGDVNNEYVDDGSENWGPLNAGNSDAEDDIAAAKEEQRNVPINRFFKPSRTMVAPKKTTKVANVDDILSEFDSAPQRPKKSKRSKPDLEDDLEVKVFKRTKKPETIPASVEVKVPEVDTDVSMTLEANKENEVSKSEDLPSQKELLDDESDDDIVITRRQRRTAKNVDRSHNFQAKKEVKQRTPEPEVIPEKVEEQIASPDVSSSTERSHVSNTDIVDEQGKFLFYWMDHAEADNTLLLFGKVKTKDGGYASALLQVRGIARELYFLPRKALLEDDEPVTVDDVRDEIVPLIMEKYGLDLLREKPEVKKYAFELPDVPEEAEYLKVLMPFNTPKSRNMPLPSNLEGSTFLKVFGTSSNIFESFVLQRRIMGPCWLEVSNADFDALKGTSHCELEISVSDPKHVVPIDEKSLALPTFSCLSLHVQPVYNDKTSTQEVAAVSMALFKDVNIDHILPNMEPVEVVTLVRPVGLLKLSFPPGLQKAAKDAGVALRTFPTEKTLISCLSALLKRYDPDFFIGHNLESSALDILMHRMHLLKVPTWSHFGRRNRKAWPERLFRGNDSLGNLFMNNQKLKEVFQGRLVCDILNELGKSVTPKCQSWDLAEMYDVVCKKKLVNLDANLNQQQYLEDSGALVAVLKDVQHRSRVSLEIAFQVQLLSLSRTLTTIAGNSWSHTLGGTRAGRSEYFLLHEFTRNNYIVPDRPLYTNKRSASENSDDDPVSRKAQYKGGLVLEPEVGLHKTFTVVMDFNSLYPSIIQEYNICFTTIPRADFNRTQKEEDLPDYPGPEVPQGILPRLLHSLVSRRKEVKKLLKDPRTTPAERASYDIKQLALKLQANSLYGFLGFEKSRFYAKALAMLVTAKGREILTETRHLAETIDLHTIYGDTDSLMIETGTTDYKAALECAAQFQQVVNGTHTVLELGLDNVFKSILLHLKKKYAAMNIEPNGDGTFTETLEVKGLDLRRREFSPLTKETSQYVLEKILSDQDPEEALAEIYEYLENLAADIKANKIRPEKFRINTRLSKDPKSYPGGKSMPQVQVALRMRKQGKMVKAGSVITYIICDGEEGSPAERARSLQEVLAKNSDLKPDPKYYLEKQLFNPLERLLQTYPGIDMVRLADSLGLEGRRFEKHNVNNHNSINGLQPFELTITDEERYKYLKFLELQCSCGHKFRYGGIIPSFDYKVTAAGIQCKFCHKTIPVLRVTAQLEFQIRAFISLYYSSWLVCSDPSCELTTRQMSVYGRKCLSGHCDGMMRYKYGDQELYRQLMYFWTIFDVEKSKSNSLKQIYSVGVSKPDPLTPSQVLILAEQNKEFFAVCQGVVDKYLNNSARRFVDMGSIFGLIQ